MKYQKLGLLLLVMLGIVVNPSYAATDLNGELTRALCLGDWNQALSIINQMRAIAPERIPELNAYWGQIEYVARTGVRLSNWPKNCTTVQQPTPVAPTTTPTTSPIALDPAKEAAKKENCAQYTLDGSRDFMNLARATDNGNTENAAMLIQANSDLRKLVKTLEANQVNDPKLKEANDKLIDAYKNGIRASDLLISAIRRRSFVAVAREKDKIRQAVATEKSVKKEVQDYCKES